MKNNTTDLLLKFKHGDNMSDMEIQELSEGLHRVVSVLRDAGVLFKACLDFAQSNLDRVNSVLDARGE